MAIAVKHRRGTTAEHASFTGAEGELTVDTDKKVVVVHDNVTAGGIPLAREDRNQRTIDPFKPGTHSGLSFAYGIGIARKDNAVTRVDAGTVLLTDNATNYIEITPEGAISANTTGYTAGKVPLFKVVTAGGTISSTQDDRCFFSAAAGGGGYTIGWNIEVMSAPTLTIIDVPV